MSNLKQIAVIGAGPSGMMAAIQAARAGAKVTVFEKQKKPGRKLAVTGNGQCNITNRGIEPSRYHGHNALFVRNVFSHFSLEDTIEFFFNLGIPLIEKKKGKLYPHSLQAQSVADILEYELIRSGAELHLCRRVDSIKSQNGKIVLESAGHEKMSFDAVILACGSSAYPQLGASDQGYDLARSAGHKVYVPFPAVLPLTVPLRILHRLEGIKWDCGMKAISEGKYVSESEGEVLFTKYGLSGPASLEISRAVNESVIKGKKTLVEIDLFPDRNDDEMKELLDLLFVDPGRTLAFALLGALKRRIPDIMLEIGGFNPEKKCGDLTAGEQRAIGLFLKAVRLEPGQPRAFSEAVVAAGGIDVNEVMPSTMESKKMKGLYITGEVLDIDGDSGGFNLQFAWSTGAIAGRSCIRPSS
jgi:hypothetical protein